MQEYVEFYIEEAQNKAKTKTMGWVSFSSLLHAGLAIAIFTLSFEVITPDKPEVIEFEVAPIAGGAPEVAEPTLAEPAPAPAVAQAPVAAPETVAPVVAKEEVVKELPKPVPAELPAKKVAAQPIAAAPKPVKTAAVAPVAKTVQTNPQFIQQESPVDAQPLDEADEMEEAINKTTVAATAPQYDEKNLDEDLNKIVQEKNAEEDAKVATAKAEMERETEKDLKEKEAHLASIQKEQKEESARLAAIAAQKKAEREAAEKAYIDGVVAKQRAEEKANAERLAAEQAEAQRIASEKAAAEKAASDRAAKGTGGSAAGVRALEELRQMPGNRKPEYETEDRLAQRQGDVNYVAYVSKDGFITQVKMMKSTGHRNLDLKTLKAIQSWKFYPGQEGWVEIPFRWDLKGGPQEMPATLRRKISQK